MENTLSQAEAAARLTRALKESDSDFETSVWTKKGFHLYIKRSEKECGYLEICPGVGKAAVKEHLTKYAGTIQVALRDVVPLLTVVDTQPVPVPSSDTSKLVRAAHEGSYHAHGSPEDLATLVRSGLVSESTAMNQDM